MNTSRDTIAAGGDVDFHVPAELIGHPARSAMLLALLDGRALPMSMLANEAGVSASTASAHLARLVDGDLLRVRQQGRHRYYALASPDVGEVLESLARLAPRRPVKSLRADSRQRALRFARSCYDHMAGHLGVALMGSLLAQGAVRGGDGTHHPAQARHDRLAARGKDIDYRFTDAGWALFDRLDIVVPSTRRPLVGYCVDWTEQRHHLAGTVGAALLARFEQLDWVRRDRAKVRALRVTDAGRRGFAEHFDISVPE